MHSRNQAYYNGLLALTIFLFLSDLIYGLLLGSSTSLIRSTGHLAFLIVLIRKHSEIKFAISLWSWVMLIILPAIYPVIALLFIVSGNIAGVEMNKLTKDLIWIIIGSGILLLNHRNKFSLTNKKQDESG